MAAEPLEFGDVAPRLRAHGFRPVPILNGTKRPPMKDWPGFVVDDAALAKYRDYGTGLLCGELVGLDVDVLHEEAATELLELTRIELGDGPRRIGQAPKVLIAYRTSAPFRKRQTKVFLINGHTAKVEALATGQQLVSHAQHPGTGRPYEWPDGDLLDRPFASLREVTEEQVAAFITKAELVLDKYGVPQKPDRVNGGESPREHREPPDDDQAPPAEAPAAN
jgi:putative DNA primase/helicase